MASSAPLDPDRTLALSYVAAPRRPAVGALWRLDLALGAVLAAGRDPLITQIKLAWWRQALERLDQAPAPAEPVLEALADEVLPRGVRGHALADMEQGWTVLLSREALTSKGMQKYAAFRGAVLFKFSALLLDGEAGYQVEAGGEAWALADLARRSGNAEERAAALAMAAERGVRLRGYRWPARLRPLGMLAMLAIRDARSVGLEPMGSPRRMLQMMRHRLTGR